MGREAPWAGIVQDRDGVRRVERSQEASLDSVRGTCDAERAWSPPCALGC